MRLTVQENLNNSNCQKAILLGRVENMLLFKQFTSAFKLFATATSLNRVYILSVKHNQHLSVMWEWHDNTLPDINFFWEKGDVKMSPDIYRQLNEFGYIYITKEWHHLKLKAVKNNLRECRTKECLLVPLFEVNHELTYLVCSRSIENNETSPIKNHIDTIQDFSLYVGKAINRLFETAYSMPYA